MDIVGMLSGTFFIFWVVLIILFLLWFVWTLIDIIKSDFKMPMKAVFIILLFIANLITMIVWLFVREK